MKVNMGCGEDYVVGWVNVDIRQSVRPDVCCDIIVWLRMELNRNGGKPFIEEFKAYDILEHFTVRELRALLGLLEKCCLPDCKGYVRVPDFNMIARTYMKTGYDGNLERFVYGGQDYAENYHKSMWDRKIAAKRFERRGFSVGGFRNEGWNLLFTVRRRYK